MIDDSVYGTRNKRGDWKPKELIEYPKVFVWPLRPLEILKWLPKFIAPWNLFYAAVAVLLWLYVIPPLETMKTFEASWILYLFACNLVMTVVFYGAFHLRLYTQKGQGTTFKYNGKWPGKGSWFLFGNQTVDNIIWTLGSGVTFWTTFQVITLWLFANGYIPHLNIEQHPVYFVVMMLLIPLFREIHFYTIHRIIHWPPFYDAVHKLHHNNTNPGPWSGLAMHPVESFLYFSSVVLHWLVMSHPVHAIFHLVHLGLTPAVGHAGFEKVVVGGKAIFDTHCYAHYLHHKHFECNYSDGAIPLDKWFGTFHDGSEEAHALMQERLAKRAQKFGQSA